MIKPITPASVFMVSGGAKGITAQCVIRMAQAYQCKFILLGRSSIAGPEPAYAQAGADEATIKRNIMAHLSAQGEKPTPMKVQRLFKGLVSRREIEGTLHEISQAGGQALYLSVDITDVETLKAKVADAVQRFGAVTGVLHGAGNLADKLIEKKTAQDFEMVYAVKVKGLENMLLVCPPEQLDHLVLFSSAAGFYGNVGQSDYALANDILNKAAYTLKASYPNCHVVSINWGPWDGGMVTPALKAYFAEMGIQVIPIEVGAQMLIDELGGASRPVQVLVGRPLAQPKIPVEAQLQTYRMRRRLSLEGNPFVADHVVGYNAVLPIVNSLSWMANSCEKLYPGYVFHHCEEVKVLKGIIFDDTLADEYTVELTEIAKSEHEIAFKAIVLSHGANSRLPRYHYSAKIYLAPQKDSPPIYQRLDLSDTYSVPGSLLYEDGTMFHGPRFQGVKWVLNLSAQTPKKVTMRCVQPYVSERDQGQFPIQAFNYYMADIGFQCLGVWARRVYDAGSLPLSCKKGIHYRDTQPGDTFYVSMEVTEDNETSLVADIYTHDEEGRLYAYLSGAEITLSKNLNTLFLQNRLVD